MRLTWHISRTDEADLMRGIEDAGRQGVAAIELLATSTGFLRTSTPEETMRLTAAAAKRAGVEITGLVLDSSIRIPPHNNITDRRQNTANEICAALDRAFWLGAKMLVLSSELSAGWAVSTDASYGDRMFEANRMLQDLRFEAQRRGVLIASAANEPGFLRSPLEAREFFDRVNSPFVGANLNESSADRIGAEDWARALTHRIARVFLAAGPDQSQARARWIKALSVSRVDCCVAIAGPGAEEIVQAWPHSASRTAYNADEA